MTLYRLYVNIYMYMQSHFCGHSLFIVDSYSGTLRPGACYVCIAEVNGNYCNVYGGVANGCQ